MSLIFRIGERIRQTHHQHRRRHATDKLLLQWSRRYNTTQPKRTRLIRQVRQRQLRWQQDAPHPKPILWSPMRCTVMGRTCWHLVFAYLTWTLNLWHPVYLLPIVFTTLEGDRIHIRFCDQKPVLINDRKQPEMLAEPSAPRRKSGPPLSTAQADPLQKEIQEYLGYFTQEIHIKQIELDHRL